MIRRVLGIDPGPTTGLCLLTWRPEGVFANLEVAQCSHGIAPQIIHGIVLRGDRVMPAGTLIAVERFVVGRKSMRTAKYGEITRDMVGALQSDYGDSVVLTNAADAKAWATDKRLEAADLLGPTAGMRHARDAARHALFAAHKHAGYPDPLSRKAVRP